MTHTPRLGPHLPPPAGRRLLSAWILSASLALVLLPGTVRAAAPDATMKLTADAARPLGAAAEGVQQRYGIAVTYEDPIWVYSGDLKASPHKVESVKGVAGKPLIIPAGSRYEVELIPSATAPLLTPMAVLDAVLQQHEATGQPGRFRVQQDGQVYHLIPDQVKNTKGQWTVAMPILDTPITLASATRDGATTLRLICDEVSASTGQKILIGLVPLNLLSPTQITLGGATTPARDLLTNLVSALPHPTSWRLAWEPNLRSFLLNMTVAPGRSESLTRLQRPAKSELSTGGGKGKDGKKG